ncbi:hypothetical protein [Saccharospirillum impatiens]|uniref:hypothetical protein n=1 Tax=Saccharospirillum impatiens TaxID=169438 RepID=UPI00042256FD|nr:hypothetical protein [Saccharospirillum impatiens]
MKSTEPDTSPRSDKAATYPPPGVGRKTLIGGLWLVSVGFWLWAGVQLGQLIGELWL